MLFRIANQLKELDLLGRVHVGGILRDIRRLTQQANKNLTDDVALGAALSGDMNIVQVSGSLSLSAAALNAAPAGTIKKYLVVALKTSRNEFHNWANFAPVVTTAEAVDDAEVAAPTIDETTPAFAAGRMALTLTLDTDEGDTKTYAEGDEVSVTIKVAADDKWLGHTVTALTLTLAVGA